MNLLDQLRRLRQQVRQLLWLTGLSWVAGGLLAGLLVIGVGDWLWHFDDRGVRAVLLAALIVAVGWLAWRRLIAPLRRPLSNLELTEHLEQRFPKLRRRLATAVEFLERDVSPSIGSPELQRRLIEQTTADVQSLDFTEVLDRREARRAALLSVSVFVIGLLLFAANSAAASTALLRLLWPLSEHAWPKSVELQLVRGDLSAVTISPDKPLRTMQGQPLDLFVVNARGPLPPAVSIEFRQRGRSSQSEPLRTTTLRSAADQTREAAAIRLPLDEGSVEFRAVGGDDQEMPWHELLIVPLPKLESFRVEITPPSYTGEGATTLPEGATQVRALVGSQLKITARTMRRARHAVADADSIGHEISLAENGRDVRWQFSVRQSGSVASQLSLTDQDGFQNASALRLEIIGVADLPPVVLLEKPATDQLVTANAMVRLAATARDDRRLREVGLESFVAATNSAVTIPPPGLPRWLVGRRTTTENGVSGSAEANEPPGQARWGDNEQWHVENVPHDEGRESSVRLDWSLSKLTPAVGDRILLRVVASDHCDVGEPRVGRSATRTLTVVSPHEKLSDIAQRLDLLLHDLESLAAKQSQTKDQTDLLRVQVEKADDFRPQDRDLLKRVELDQRQIGSRLTGRGDGAIARARELLAQLEDNQLSDSVTRERLNHIALAIEGLNRETLPTLESLLGRAVKESSGTQPPAGFAGSFPTITARQAEVLTTLTELIRDLTQWRDRRELAREIAELANVQETLNRDTSELAPQTLGKSASQLPSQQQADVAKLADRQARQAERIEQLRQRLVGHVSNVPGQPTEEKEKLEEGGHIENVPHEELAAELDRRALAAKAREAAREVAENNLGQAGRTQQQLADELKALANQLSQTSTANGEEDVRALQELEGQLDSLTQQQRRLLEETREAASKADSLTTEQLAEESKSLRDRQATAKQSADELASKLKSTRADESREALRRATRHMQQAESQLADKQLERGADEEQTALDDLEQSRRELAAARRAAQQQQLAEKTNGLAEAVRELIVRQQTVVDETQKLSAEQQKSGKWTRPLSKAALNLGEAEQELAEGTSELSKSLTDIEAVRLTLDRATDDLAAAASRLRDKQLDEETRRREQSALHALQSLADALAPPAQSPETQAAEQSPEEQKQNDSSEEPVPPIAQLKLLRQLQSVVGDSTRSVETRAPMSPPNDEEAQRREAELRQLAVDQQSVRDATSRLLERVPAAEPTAEPPPAISEETTPRETALSAMQQSFEKLRASETGKPTQAVQQSAVDSLDKLLKQWQQRAAQQQSLARSGQPAPMPNKTPNDDSSTTDGNGGKPTGRDSAQARNSSDRDHTGTDAAGDLRRQRQLREAVWGHLPPALREKMLNLPHDKTLPKYSEHIRRYYESLAEQE